jgi:hypothetical protein
MHDSCSRINHKAHKIADPQYLCIHCPPQQELVRSVFFICRIWSFGDNKRAVNPTKVFLWEKMAAMLQQPGY